MLTRIVLCILLLPLMSSPVLAGELEDLRFAAGQGNAEAQCKLGHLYGDGIGVPLDHKESLKWYNLAAEQGHAEAQYSIGFWAFIENDNRQIALKWLHLAAEQGHDKAMELIADIYFHGYGVPQDQKTAKKWYQLAAERGNARAQHSLGNCYKWAWGVPKNLKEAFKWYQLAAVQGLPDAQTEVSLFYEIGQGTPRNYLKAYAWASVARANGAYTDKYYEDKKGRLEQEMTPGLITAAQAYSKEIRKALAK